MKTDAEQFEHVRKTWSDTLAPRTPAERRLVNYIACQEWLLFCSLRRCAAGVDRGTAAQQQLRQCRLADSIESLIAAVNAIQQRGTHTDPPPAQPSAAGKVVVMPKRASSDAVAARSGSGPVVQLNLDPLPELHPFDPAPKATRSGRRPKVDFTRAGLTPLSDRAA